MAAPQWTTNAQQVAPSAATGASITPNGTAWTNSGWVQLLASVSAASVLTGVEVTWPSLSCEFEVDIGTGAAASEVAIATVRGATVDNSGGPAWMWFPIGIDNIANGARLSAQLRKSGTNTTAWNVAATYLLKAVTGTFLTTAVATTIVPAAAAGTSVTAGGSAWANGSWTQLIASTSAAIVVVGVQVKGGAAAECELDLGTGGAGSETVVTTLRWWNNNNDGGPFVYPVVCPLDNIATSTRVAVRARSSTGSYALTVALIYHAKPL